MADHRARGAEDHDRAWAGQLARQPVHRADELGDERGGRPGVQLGRVRDLFQPAVAHDADPVGHGQRLFLVVRDEDRRRAEPLLQGADLLPQLQPDLGVERGQRLVEQQHVRLDRQRPRQRDTLLLAAGQLVRVLARLRGQADHVEQPSWLDKCSWLRTTVNGRLLDHGPQPSVLSRFIPQFSIGFNQLSPGSTGQYH
jgi:hypothetical protein